MTYSRADIERALETGRQQGAKAERRRLAANLAALKIDNRKDLDPALPQINVYERGAHDMRAAIVDHLQVQG